MSLYSVPLLLLITKGCKNDRRGLVPSHATSPIEEKRTETSKEKTFKINVNIEDVGLTED